MPNIYYAVIAPTAATIDDVLTQLDAAGKAGVAAWLRKAHAGLYGATSDQWKPFGSYTMTEMMRDKSDIYSCQSILLDGIDPGDPDDIIKVITSPVQVYFIDAFATFHPNYKSLAGRIDSHVSLQARCCVLCHPDSPVEVATHARSSWPLVRQTYRKGKPHRFVQEEDDFENFKNLTIDLLLDPTIPDLLVKNALSEGLNTSRRKFVALR